MERQHPQPQGGDHNPEVNSYGTDDPEAQARIEQARIEASEQRKRDRARLEQLVEQGMRRDDAEALIEFEHYVREQREQTERTARATELAVAGVTPDDGRPTSLEDTRTDLTDLLELRQQPEGAATLAEFADFLRRGAKGDTAQMPSDPATVAMYQAMGLNHRDALTVAGFEYFLRDKLRRAGDPAADVGTEEREQDRHYQPRVYVMDSASAEQGMPHGRWIDANQSTEELEAAVAAMLETSPAPDAARWTVTEIDDFAGVELVGASDSWLITTLGRGVAEHGAAFAAWVEVQGTDDRDLLAQFEDFYVGSYDSPESWARAVGEDLEWEAQLDRVVDPVLRPYLKIDYARFAREQGQAWDVFQGVDGKTHVFMR